MIRLLWIWLTASACTIIAQNNFVLLYNLVRFQLRLFSRATRSHVTQQKVRQAEDMIPPYNEIVISSHASFSFLSSIHLLCVFEPKLWILQGTACFITDLYAVQKNRAKLTINEITSQLNKLGNHSVESNCYNLYFLSKVVKTLKQFILSKCQDSISMLYHLSALLTSPTKVFLLRNRKFYLIFTLILFKCFISVQ